MAGAVVKGGDIMARTGVKTWAGNLIGAAILHRMSNIRRVPIWMLLSLLVSCAGQGQHAQTGTVIGGLLGGVLGSQVGDGRGRTAAIIAGTLIGTAVGGSIGQSMDEVDRQKVVMSLENVRTGVPTRWQNPDSGNAYAVVPTRTWTSNSGPCREYTIDARVAGQEDSVYCVTHRG
jgi:surface antigen